MITAPVFFYLFAGLAIACSLLVVLKRNPVSSAFALVLVFFAFAGIYALMNAHLIAALQILVYAGAIMVLFVFVIMLLNADFPAFEFNQKHSNLRIGMGLLAGVVLAVFLTQVFHDSDIKLGGGAYPLDRIEASGGNTRVISSVLFSEYILPFELTSVLLLAAIVGTVAIAMRKKSKRSVP